MFFALCLSPNASGFQEGDQRLIYETTEKSVPLVELYASDARSSCNKAVEHFNSYKQKDPKTDLWKKFVPIVMHVSLWDIPGHKDIFSKKEFNTRLAIYQKNWSVRQVYAPTVVANGLEWSGWARGQNIPMPNRDKAGILKVDGSKKEDVFQVDFVPSKDLEGKSFVVHASLLGFGLRSKPAEGTNQNRSLQHDFVALFLQQQDLKLKDGRHTATVEISRKGLWIKEYAVVFWVSEKDDNRSLQATGGFLPI
jgi:hypothetical protein